MIGEALEVSIVVSMVVLVGYPSTLLFLDTVQEQRAQWSRLIGRMCRE